MGERVHMRYGALVHRPQCGALAPRSSLTDRPAEVTCLRCRAQIDATVTAMIAKQVEDLVSASCAIRRHGNEALAQAVWDFAINVVQAKRPDIVKKQTPPSAGEGASDG